MTTEHPDGDAEEAEVSYWRAAMDEAFAFMRRCLRHPVEECGERLLALEPACAEAGVEVRFAAEPHVHGLPRLFLLREGLVERFCAAAAAFNEEGLVLRVEDGYRSVAMQRGLALHPATIAKIAAQLRREPGPPDGELLFRRVSALVATRPRVGTHMSGSALDVSVLERTSGRELDRGGPYLELSPRTPMDSPFVTAAQAQARRAIGALMARGGFVAYPYEFWHYSAGDVFAAELGGEPARYGAVSLEPGSGATTPLPDAEAALVAPDELVAAFAAALAPGLPA